MPASTSATRLTWFNEPRKRTTNPQVAPIAGSTKRGRIAADRVEVVDRCHIASEIRKMAAGQVASRSVPTTIGARRCLEEIDRVTHGIESTAEGENEPLGIPPRREHGQCSDDHGQENEVGDRIGEQRDNREGRPAHLLRDRVKGERGDDRRGPQARHDAVEPCRQRQLPDFDPHQQDDRHTGEWVEQEVEGVGRRRGRRVATAQRLDAPEDVPERPGQETSAEGDRHWPKRASDERPGDAQQGDDDLEAVDHPVVQEGRLPAVGIHDEHHHVRGQQRRPGPSRRSRSRASSARASPCRRPAGSRYESDPLTRRLHVLPSAVRPMTQAKWALDRHSVTFRAQSTDESRHTR